jgi:Holliday junction resolvase RusA-like endonuclease
MYVVFSVPFVKAKERPRVVGHAFTPTKTKNAEKRLRDAYKGACVRRFGHVVTAPAGIPVTVAVAIRKAAPKRRPRHLPKAIWELGRWAFTDTIDIDNVLKLCCDALNPITHWDRKVRKTVVDEYVAWHDDSQITEMHGFKLDRKRGTTDMTAVLVAWEEDE